MYRGFRGVLTNTLFLLQMISLNFYGSSHIGARHGLQSALRKQYNAKDDVFKSKFRINTMYGVSGLTYYNYDVISNFFEISNKLSYHPEYAGQINVVILGR